MLDMKGSRLVWTSLSPVTTALHGCEGTIIHASLTFDCKICNKDDRDE